MNSQLEEAFDNLEMNSKEGWPARRLMRLPGAFDNLGMNSKEGADIDDQIATIVKLGASHAYATLAADRLRGMITASSNPQLQLGALECLAALVTVTEPAKAAFKELKASGLIDRLTALAEQANSCDNALIGLLNAPHNTSAANEAAALIVHQVTECSDIIPYVRPMLARFIRTGISDDARLNALAVLLAMQGKREFVSLVDELSCEDKLAPLIELKRRKTRRWWHFWRSHSKINNREVCANCGKMVRPYKAHRGGQWSGTAEELVAMPQLEADNAFLCDNCSAIVCPICSRDRASKLGVKMFVCTQCGNKPIKTIFRK